MTKKNPAPVEGKVEASAEARADLVVAEANENAVALFTDPKQYSEFYERMKATVSTHVPDVTTDKGRRAIASLAYRVTRAKTTLDKAGLGLTEGWRNQIKAVNESRFKMVAELDQLADEVRKPLTEWEQAEEARQLKIEATISLLEAAAVIAEDDTAATVEARGREIFEDTLDADVLGDRLDEVQGVKDRVVESLLRARDRLRQEEADRAELERLRRENEERLAREAAEREERETAERVQAEADRLAREKQEREEAEERRVHEAEERAAQAARDAAEKERREEEERRQREHDKALEKERKAREEAERLAEEAAKRERDRVAAQEAEAAANAKREKDKAHRREVQAQAAEDLVQLCKLDKEKAEKVVLAIASGSVRNAQIVY